MRNIVTQAKRKRILVVDDNAAHRRTICLGLKHKGYETLEAADGLEAVETATARRPDLIIMDFMMPVLNGIEATKRLRSSETTGQTPILMLTVFNQQKRILSGLLNGVSDYIVKGSMKMTELANRVECLLEAHECSRREPHIAAEIADNNRRGPETRRTRNDGESR